MKIKTLLTLALLLFAVGLSAQKIRKADIVIINNRLELADFSVYEILDTIVGPVSDSSLVTAKAVKDYVDANSGGGGGSGDVSFTDSLTTFVTPSQLADSLLLAASTYGDSLYNSSDSVAIWRVPMFDNGNLSNWRRAVADTSTNRVVNVVIYGDSNTEWIPWAFTIPTRDRLSSLLGNAGYGWMNMRTDRQDHVDVIDSGTWWSSGSLAYGDYALDLFDRTWYASAGDGLEYEFTPSSLSSGVDAAKPSAQCTQVQFHYYGIDATAQLAFEITNENNPTTYDTITTSLGYNMHTVDLPEFGYHDVKATCIADSVIMMAYNLTTPDTISGRSGAIVHRVGHSGATAGNYHIIPDTLINQQLSNLDADIVIFNLGGNNFNNPAEAKSELDSLINKIRLTNDSIDIAILAPSETSSSGFSNGQKHDRNYWYLSRKHRAGFLSLFQIVGNYDNAQNDGFYVDGAHFSTRAGRMFGERIVGDLLGIYGLYDLQATLSDTAAAIRADFPVAGSGGGMGIDSTVIGGTNESILFVDGTTLAEDTDFAFDNGTGASDSWNTLRVGTQGDNNGKGRIHVFSNTDTDDDLLELNYRDSNASYRGLLLLAEDDNGGDDASIALRISKNVDFGRFQLSGISQFQFIAGADDRFQFNERIRMEGVRTRDNRICNMMISSNNQSTYPVIGFRFHDVSDHPILWIGEDELIGIGEDSATVSLDMGWTTDAMRLSVGTTAQRPTNLNFALIRGNSTIGVVETYDGTRWNNVTPLEDTPTGTSDSTGEQGDLYYDDDYIYIKTSAGWKRSALSTW